MSLRPWWVLAAAAIVFLALWGWRELGVRVEKENGASRDAEIRRLHEENTRLKEQISKLETNLGAGTAMLNVTGPQSGSARVFVYGQGRGVLVTTDLPKGKYALHIDSSTAPPVATIVVPDSGEKTVMLSNLPAQASDRSFVLTAVK